MLGIVRMDIKGGSRQKHRTFFSGNVEMLGNLRMDIKGGVHKSREPFFWSSSKKLLIQYKTLERLHLMMKREDVTQGNVGGVNSATFPYCDWWLRCCGSNSRDVMSISNIKTNPCIARLSYHSRHKQTHN